MPRRLLWLLAGTTVLRALIAADLPLLHDEAYYWLWSRHLDWSYLDHPPLIAWLIRVATVPADGEIWIRLPALALGPAIAYALFLLGREMFDERAGMIAAVLYQVAPILGGTGVFSTPDAPMYLGWTLTLLFGWQVLNGRPERWAAAGAALGFGLLSKMYTLVLAAGLAGYLVTAGRPWLRRREPYLAALLAIVIFLPVLYWNVTHNWASVRFMLSERSEIGAPPGPGALRRLLEQHVPLALFLFPAFVWALVSAWHRRSDPRFAYLLWASAPAALLAFLVAPWGAARGHLPGPAYIGLAVVLAALWRRLVAGLTVANAAAAAVFAALVLFPALPPIPGAREIYGWREAGQRVLQEISTLPGTPVIVASRFQVAAQLSYHTRQAPRPVLLLPMPNRSSIWPAPESHRGSDAVAVTYAPERFAVERCFGTVEERSPLTVLVRHRPVQEFRVFRLGGLRLPCQVSRVD